MQPSYPPSQPLYMQSTIYNLIKKKVYARERKYTWIFFYFYHFLKKNLGGVQENSMTYPRQWPFLRVLHRRMDRQTDRRRTRETARRSLGRSSLQRPPSPSGHWSGPPAVSGGLTSSPGSAGRPRSKVSPPIDPLLRCILIYYRLSEGARCYFFYCTFGI